MSLLGSSAALAQMSPVGLWQTIDDNTKQARAEIRIKADANGMLSGVIEKALVTSDEVTCVKCSDDRKDKPKLGMEIIRGAKKADDKDVWEGGKILDTDSGSNYTLRLTPIDGGKKLEVRGSFFGIGRTQTWNRLQ